MSAKPRNNYAKLPWEIRKRVLRLLLDGAEYEAIRRDPEVAAACAARGLTLHNTTFAAVRRSDDSLMETEKRTGKFKWASEALKNTAGLQEIANVAQLHLLEQLRGIAENSEADPADLLRLTNAITKIKESADNERLDELRRKLREEKARFDAAETEWKTREAELLAHIAELENRENKSEGGLSEEAIRRAEEKIRLL